MEGGVEAGDLHEFGTRRGERAHGSEIMRQVKRVERDQRAQGLQQCRRDEFRRDMLGSAMNDSMSDGAKARVAEMIVDELQ
jgi:hypothetical protein